MAVKETKRQLSVNDILKRYRILLKGGALLFLTLIMNFILYFFFISPIRSNIQKLENRWISTRNNITQMVLYNNAHNDLIKFREDIVGKREFVKIVEKLSYIAKNSNIVIPSIEYHTEEGEGGIKKVLFSFSLDGRYRDIRRFIYNIEKEKDFIIIEDLILTKSRQMNSNIHLEINIGGYFY
ncbi:MAG: GspMb/PilO family protein [Nitrospirota bacterium]